MKKHSSTGPISHNEHMIEVDVVRSNEKVKAPKQSAKWQAMFAHLEAYRKENGDCLVPRGYAPNKKLATWVAEQRKQYKLWFDGRTSKMTQERIQQLESIGFSWSAQEAAWDRHFEELKRFKKEHGHCLVPVNFTANPSLGCWIKEQRRHCNNYIKGKASHMTAARLQKLESVGFQCDPHDAAWWERFEELKQYKATHGHCMVSTKTGGPLGAWVHHQRRLYRKTQSSTPSSSTSPSSSPMTQSRIEALNGLGFCWAPRGNSNGTDAVEERAPAPTPQITKVEPEQCQSAVPDPLPSQDKEAVKEKVEVVEATPEEIVPLDVTDIGEDMMSNMKVLPRHSLMLEEDCFRPDVFDDLDSSEEDNENVKAVFFQFCFDDELASLAPSHSAPEAAAAASADDDSVSTTEIDNILFNNDDDDISLFSLMDEQLEEAKPTPAKQPKQTITTTSARSKKARKHGCDEVYPWEVTCDGRVWSKKQKSVNDWRNRRAGSAIFFGTFENILHVQLEAIQEEVHMATMGAIAAGAA